MVSCIFVLSLNNLFCWCTAICRQNGTSQWISNNFAISNWKPCI
jgi:hypothetical protein